MYQQPLNLICKIAVNTLGDWGLKEHKQMDSTSVNGSKLRTLSKILTKMHDVGL